MNEVKSKINEPLEAFPYSPPSDEIKIKYSDIFEISEPLKPRLFKTLFDKIVALILLAISIPILILLKIAYIIEGILIPENKGPMLFFIGGSVEALRSRNGNCVSSRINL